MSKLTRLILLCPFSSVAWSSQAGALPIPTPGLAAPATGLESIAYVGQEPCRAGRGRFRRGCCEPPEGGEVREMDHRKPCRDARERRARLDRRALARPAYVPAEAADDGPDFAIPAEHGLSSQKHFGIERGGIESAERVQRGIAGRAAPAEPVLQNDRPARERSNDVIRRPVPDVDADSRRPLAPAERSGAEPVGAPDGRLPEATPFLATAPGPTPIPHMRRMEPAPLPAETRPTSAPLPAASLPHAPPSPELPPSAMPNAEMRPGPTEGALPSMPGMSAPPAHAAQTAPVPAPSPSPPAHTAQPAPSAAAPPPTAPPLPVTPAPAPAAPPAAGAPRRP